MKDNLHYIATSPSKKTVSSISCQRLKRSLLYGILSSSLFGYTTKVQEELNYVIVELPY